MILSEEHGLATSREGAGAKIQAKQVGFLDDNLASQKSTVGFVLSCGLITHSLRLLSVKWASI